MTSFQTVFMRLAMEKYAYKSILVYMDHDKAHAENIFQFLSFNT